MAVVWNFPCVGLGILFGDNGQVNVQTIVRSDSPPQSGAEPKNPGISGCKFQSGGVVVIMDVGVGAVRWTTTKKASFPWSKRNRQLIGRIQRLSGSVFPRGEGFGDLIDSTSVSLSAPGRDDFVPALSKETRCRR